MSGQRGYVMPGGHYVSHKTQPVARRGLSPITGVYCFHASIVASIAVAS